MSVRLNDRMWGTGGSRIQLLYARVHLLNAGTLNKLATHRWKTGKLMEGNL